ncbi:MAG: hypothetical protein JWN95_3888 [Frankiales bacterium]|nr:hypothetical protein [Frankiales bacterium]
MPAPQCRLHLMRRSAVSLVSIGLISVAIAACGGPKQPVSEPSDPLLLNTISAPAPTPTSTPTSGAISTTLPADVPTRADNPNKPGEKPPLPPAQATGPLGAQGFARFYMQTNDWAYATGSTTYMNHYFRPSCVECKSLRDAVDRATRLHRRLIGYRVKVKSVQSVGDVDQTLRQSVLVSYDTTSGEVVDEHDKFVTGTPAIQNSADQLDLAWTASGWVVVRGTPIR